jgi:2-haloacid dehalogenase
LIEVYDRWEHAFGTERPHRNFRSVAGCALAQAMQDLGLACDDADIDTLTSAISTMPPFPEVPGALLRLKQAGFRTCIISNTDDDIIAGNVAQLGAGNIDRIVTAEQAGAYKPSAQIFDFAHRELGITRDDTVHICASPHLDLVAARDLGFRCVWIDRGTGRTKPADYAPNAILPSLDRVPELFETLGWAI